MADRPNHLTLSFNKFIPFDDVTKRTNFMKMTYGILFLQFLVVSVVTVMFLYIESLNYLLKEDKWAVIFLFFLLGLAYSGLAFSVSIRRSKPHNTGTLALIVLLQSIATSSLTVYNNSCEVWVAMLSISVAMLFLALLSTQNSLEIDICVGLMALISVYIAYFALVCYFLKKLSLRMLYSCMGGFAFCVFALIDTRLMVSNWYPFYMQTDEYVFAVLNIFVEPFTLLRVLFQQIRQFCC